MSTTERNYSTDFLRFSAYSIKDLITRKLAADSNFSDLMYEGSNIAILVDIVSYMYQCLIYNLNNTASESMFADTQIYENINRLVKFLGYNPLGAVAGTATFLLDRTNEPQDIEKRFQGNILYKYSAIDTKLTDNNGKKVYFSLRENHLVTAEKNQTFVFYNGIWKLYSTVFTGSGEPYQTLLTELKSNTVENSYIQSDKIDVYVDEGSGPKLWLLSESGLFVNNNMSNKNYIYDDISNIYTVRLNENKLYEISFGNGTNGRCPPLNSLIYIFYLDSNDPSVKLTLKLITDVKLRHSSSLFGISDTLYNSIFNCNDGAETLSVYENGTYSNITVSTTTTLEETVEDIRLNAPQWYKLTNRLITTSDWEYYIKNKYKSYIADVKCQNNWGYVSSFYRWLYNIGITAHQNPKYYLSLNKILREFKYADPADSNNVYLWIKTKNDSDIQTEAINSDVLKIKVITQQPICCKPLGVQFAICAEEEDSIKTNYFLTTNKEFDPNKYSLLELTLDNNAMFTTNELKHLVAQILQDYFTEYNNTLGANIDYNVLLEKIYSIPSISRVRTVYKNTETGAERIRNGICFASWTTDYINIGDDLEVSNSSKTLEDFLYPLLYLSATIIERITVIKKTVSNTSIIRY